MRVANWNLMRAKPGVGGRANLLQERMAQVSADVWILTETFSNLAPGSDYELVAKSSPAGDRHNAQGECWVAIWARKGVGTPLPLAAEPDRTAGAKISLPGRRSIAVIGTVLPWLSDKKRGSVRGAAALSESLDVQGPEWQRVGLREFDGRLVVAGDFNQDLDTKHYYGSRRGRLALRNALAEAKLECVTAGHNDPVLTLAGRPNIDHLCSGHGLKIAPVNGRGAWQRTSEAGSEITDHFGVWCEFADA